VADVKVKNQVCKVKERNAVVVVHAHIGLDGKLNS